MQSHMQSRRLVRMTHSASEASRAASSLADRRWSDEARVRSALNTLRDRSQLLDEAQRAEMIQIAGEPATQAGDNGE